MYSDQFVTVWPWVATYMLTIKVSESKYVLN